MEIRLNKRGNISFEDALYLEDDDINIYFNNVNYPISAQYISVM